MLLLVIKIATEGSMGSLVDAHFIDASSLEYELRIIVSSPAYRD